MNPATIEINYSPGYYSPIDIFQFTLVSEYSLQYFCNEICKLYMPQKLFFYDEETCMLWYMIYKGLDQLIINHTIFQYKVFVRKNGHRKFVVQFKIFTCDRPVYKEFEQEFTIFCER